MSLSNVFSTYIRPIKEWYSEINSATLTGAIDVIVVEQPNGSYLSSPFHVRFGKLGVLKAKEKIVDIEVNHEPVDIHMKLDDNGAAFFVEGYDNDDDVEIPPELATSPLPDSIWPTSVAGNNNNNTGKNSANNQNVIQEEEDDDDSCPREAESSTSSPSSRDASKDRTDQAAAADTTAVTTAAQPQEGAAAGAVKKLSVRRKRKRVSKGHVRTGSKTSIEKFVLETTESTDDIFTMDDLAANAKKAAQQPEASSTPTPTNPMPPPFASLELGVGCPPPPPATLMSMSMPTSPAMSIKKNHSIGSSMDDAATPTGHAPFGSGGGSGGLGPVHLSSSCSRLHDPEANQELLQRNENSFFLSRLPQADALDKILLEEKMKEVQKKQSISCAAAATAETQPAQQKLSTAAHYFSEPELDNSPMGSRPDSPILSDTEFESQKRVEETQKGEGEEQEQSWEWGQLPSSPNAQAGAAGSNAVGGGAAGQSAADQKAPSAVKGDSQEVQKKAESAKKEGSKGWRWLFGSSGGSSNGGNNGTAKSKSESEAGKGDPEQGVYIEDLDTLNEEKLKIYVGSNLYNKNISPPKTSNCMPVPHSMEDDTESGNGPSLPMSPHSVEGGAGGTLVKFENNEFDRHTLKDVDISLCGGVKEPGFSTLLFEQGKLSFDDFVDRLKMKNVDLFESPNLVVRMGEQYYTWQAACPIIMSSVLYGRPLPSELVEVVAASYQEPKPASAAADVETAAAAAAAAAEPTPQLKVDTTVNLETPDVTATPPPTPAVENNAQQLSTTADKDAAVEKKSSSWWPFSSKNNEEAGNKTPTKAEEQAATASAENVAAAAELMGGEAAAAAVTEAVTATATAATEGEEVMAKKSPTRKSRTAVNESTSSDCSTSDEFLATIAGQKAGRYKKTLRLSNELIAKLNLKSGSNEVQFSVTTAFQGTTRCNCHVYLWKWTDKVVISDIDGTITKSDVLGHVLPIIGRDWAQSGVASLFTKIKNNGYHIAYLSARAIGQASITKDYLQSVTQGDLNLPDGPLLLNPTSLVNAFHREVIIKKPEDFKIACLRDIQKLFPDFQTEDGNPFYAGYGNRVNDVWAYTAVQIPVSRIFTINPKGELRHALTQAYRASYCSQSDMVDHIFPPLDSSYHVSEPLTFSEFSFWRDPLPSLDIENELRKIDDKEEADKKATSGANAAAQAASTNKSSSSSSSASTAKST